MVPRTGNKGLDQFCQASPTFNPTKSGIYDHTFNSFVIAVDVNVRLGPRRYVDHHSHKVLLLELVGLPTSFLRCSKAASAILQPSHERRKLLPQRNLYCAAVYLRTVINSYCLKLANNTVNNFRSFSQHPLLYR